MDGEKLLAIIANAFNISIKVIPILLAIGLLILLFERFVG